MPDSAPAARQTLRIVVLLIVIWGAYLVIGSFQQSPARAAVLAAMFIGFLAFWWAALTVRKHRLEREARAAKED